MKYNRNENIQKEITEKGYAKINLHLDITGVRADGYHSVSTVMQTVSLCDVLTLSDISLTDGEPHFSVSCNIAGVPCDEKNLAVRAALLLCECVGVSLTAKIDIQKNIPMAAGMAGGSADGAAVLRGLNSALGWPLSIDELCRLGARLGADVPFCIVGGTIYADGRGDMLHEFPKMPDCAIVVACEGEGVSTPWAYRLIDSVYGNFDGSVYAPREVAALKEALVDGNVRAVSENLYNVFEAPVLAERPVATKVKALMEEGGALRAMMSGSGPSVFGIFENDACAESAAKLLEGNGYRAYVCRTM
ncbi:MAG: 4-(cytidine 5'-diphospho)-2-C-methyl-D-erythritol kinase [Clostridia bacterium]|nr:4-(cytidine 5'-diphospho)-2-C-methyl-D-erythritol kinase [Clostridia bacterium]